MNGKIKRKVEKDGSVRLHEAVSDSVYMRGDGLTSQTLTEYARPHRISFLHISDAHGATAGYSYIRGTIMPNSDDVAALNTGDLETTGNQVRATDKHWYYLDSISGMVASWNASHSERPFLFVKGNHDAVDMFIESDGTKAAWETNFTTSLGGETSDEAIRAAKAYANANTPITLNAAREAAMFDDIVGAINTDGTNQLVTYGDTTGFSYGDDKTGYAGYWHKDFDHNGVTLRFIALDEYEHSLILSGEGEGINANTSSYAKTYSEAQMTWLVNLLKATPSDYYIVLCHHHPVYSLHPAEVVNDFTHHGLVGQSEQYLYGMSESAKGNTELPAQIIDAYLRRRKATITWTNTLLKTTSTNYSCSVTVDFSDTVPAHFACHISGHTHRDFCEYHPNYPAQLCLTIASNYNDDRADLVRASSGLPARVINRVTIDTDRNIVEVDRIGASELKSNVLIADGSSRLHIEFPIKAVEVEPKAVLLLKEAFAALDLDFEQFKSDYGDD